MGEAKRRKNLDPNYGKFSKSISASHFKQGVKFEQQKEYQKAIYFYSQAIESDPSNSEAYFARGNVHDELGNYLNAINDYSEYIKLSGGSFKGFNNRALVYLKLEQDEDAIPDLEQAIKLDHSRPWPYQQLGALVWEQGKLTRSIELCRKAAQLYQKENDREGYQTCLEMINEGETNRGLIKMALNDPHVDEINWGEFHSTPADLDDASSVSEQDDYECYGDRAEYFRGFDFHLNKGGAFEKGLPKSHKYRSVRESKLFEFIQNAVENEEQATNYILSKVKVLSDLTEIQPDLLNLVDKSIMSKRNGDINQAFKYYDQVFSHNQTWFMLWYGLAKLLCLFREYRMAFACIKICTYLYPKMWNGRQYRSDHNLSYHYDQIYSLAIAGEENESYLKTLGCPLNTVRIANPNGKVRGNSPVGRVKVVKSESLSSAIKTQKKTEIHDLSFPITPRKACKLNQKLKVEGLGWFYKEFMTQNNMLESQCYVTEVIPDIHPRISPQKFSVDGEDFSLPVVCFHPESNIIKVLGLKEGEVVLVSRFDYFEQIQQKALKPQFFGCVKIVENIAQHYGYVARHTWDSIDCSDEEENSLIVHPLKNSDDEQEEKVKTIIEMEELGISVDRILIKVNISHIDECEDLNKYDEYEEQQWQEVFVYLLNNAEPYGDRITALINEKFGDNWFTMNWTES